MLISNFSFKKQIQCNKYHFINEIHNKKTISEIKIKGVELKDILNKMYDNLGNDLTSLPSLTIDEYYQFFKEQAYQYLDVLYSNINNIQKEYTIRYQKENISYECLYDYFVENEDEIVFIKISTQTSKSFLNAVGKRNYNILENGREKILLSKAGAKIKESSLMDDVAFSKFIYINSVYFNPYKINKFKVLLVNNLDDGQEYDLIDITDVVDIYRSVIEEKINTFIELNKNNTLVLDQDCTCTIEDKKCPYYNICQRKINNENDEEYEIINSANITKELKKITYPIYYLDFESFACPCVRFEGEKAYTQHVFLYSLIIEEYEGAPLVYKNYLAQDNKNDYRFELFSQLINDIDLSKGGTVMVYNDSFEKSRINEACQYFPLLSNELENINNHIYDLMYLLKGSKKNKVEPKECNYYNSVQNGSYSIKKVLPIFDEEGYSKMEIKNGTEASVVYANFHNFNDNELKKNKKDLIDYCNKDVYGMYVVFEGIKKKLK